MDKPEKKGNRRDFIFTASYTVGAIGLGATIWPLIDQMNPDSSVKALASTEVDKAKLNLENQLQFYGEGNLFLLKEEHKKKLIKQDQLTLVN